MADIISLMSAEGYKGRHKGYSWSEIFAAMQYRTVLELEVMGIEEHELNGESIRCWVLDFGEGVKGLVPRMESGVNGNEMIAYVGKLISFVIVNVDRENQLVLCSREKALQSQRERMLRSLKEGDQHNAIVRFVSPYRLVLEVGGFIFNLGRSDVLDVYADLPDLFQVDEEIPVEIVQIDQEKGTFRIRVLNRNPWDLVGKKYHIGGIYVGTIRRALHVGYFIELEPGVSVFSRFPRTWRRRLPQEGEKVAVKIDRLDQNRKRLIGRIMR